MLLFILMVAISIAKVVSCNSAYKSCQLQQFIQNLSVAIAHTYSCQLKWCVKKLTTAIVHTKVVDCISANINQQL